MTRYLSFFALLTAAVSIPAARAAVPEKITYQGNLRESGLLVTGSRSMTFRLYNTATGGTPSWTSPATPVSISTGVFRAVLDPAGLDWENARWLEVEVAGIVLSPREELTAAPFAADALLHSGKKYTNAGTAPSSPAAGDLWFDTGSNTLKFWSGSGWTSTAGSGAAHAATHAGAGGDPIASLGAYTLTGIVTMSPGTSLAAGAGNLGVNVSSHLVVAGSINPASNLSVGGPGFSVAFASAVSAGWFYGDGSGLIGVSASPGGAAGGDLAGSYPNPVIAAAAVTDAKVSLSTGAVSSGRFGDARLAFSTAALASGRWNDAQVAITTGAIIGGFNAADQLVKLAADGGLTASSGTFTASGPNQYSLSLSSGIYAPAGTINAGLFVGSGAGLTNVTASPGGAAGGDLAGTYPSPTLAADRVRRAGDAMSGQLTISGSSATIVDTNVGGSGDAFSLAVTTAPDRSVYHLLVSTAGNVEFGGLLKRRGNAAYGSFADTHINLGVNSVTGWTNDNYNYATVGGGFNNQARSWNATVAGGENNTASGGGGAVGGGVYNTASSWNATVAGGNNNSASATDSTVGGGLNNTASGAYSMVPGGRDSLAQGNDSFAAGRQAKALAQGSFVWADSQASDFSSTVPDQFLARAQGGFAVYASSAGFAHPSVGTMFTVDGSSAHFKVPLYDQSGALVSGGGSSGWTKDGAVVRLTAPSDNVVVQSTMTVQGNAFSVGGSTFVVKGGNVGVGTANPAAMLDVTGKVNTNAAYQINGSTVVAILSGTDSFGTGVDAGRSNTGNRNSFVGAYAGYNTTTGNDNTFVGQRAGYNITVTYGNTFVGDRAGYSNTSGEGSYVGWAAGYNNTGWRNTFIGYQSGYGGASASGGDNSFVGVKAGYSNTTGSVNSFMGNEAGYSNNTGSYNAAMGYAAGRSNTSGSYNTFMGAQAGYNTTTASNNSFVGYYAGFSNTTGANNVVMGYKAGNASPAGSANTMLGSEAGFGYNAFGTTFSSSTIVGYRAGYSLTTGGDNNILLGWRAGDGLTSGSNNIIIGYDQDAPAAATSNFLNIGGVLYGDLSSLKAGIGTVSPSARLHVSSANAIASDAILLVSSGTSGGQELLVVNGDGKVGIGTASPGAALEVSGQIKVTGGAPGTGKVLTSDAAGLAAWQTPSGIPSGFVGFFNLAACPAGWTELAAARGRSLVGLPLGGTLSGTVGTALSNLEDRAVGQHSHGVSDSGHSHGVSDPGHTHPFGKNATPGSYLSYNLGEPTSSNTFFSLSPANITGISINSAVTGVSIQNSGSVAGTNAPYIQLLVCQKD